MRKIVLGLMLLLVSFSVGAQTAPSDYLPLFDRIPNAAIRGCNDLHIVNVTPEEAAKACIEGQYLSFDYYKETREADLSYTTAQSAGGLDTDYPGNPYDHYSYLGGLDRNTLVIVEEGPDSPITYELVKLDDSGNILTETDMGLNSSNGEVQYQNWKSMDIQNYSYTLQMNQSHWLIATIKLVVQDSVVIDYEILEQYGYGTGRENILLTIDDLFTEYILSEEYHSIYTTITYDERWRFPALYSYDIELMIDEEVYWTISDFTLSE